MKIIDTKTKTFQNTPTFYISVKGSDKVLFSTMGGYYLHPVTNRNSEYERVLSYDTYEQAHEKIQTLQKGSAGSEVRNWNFAVIEIITEEKITRNYYQPVRTDKEDEEYSLKLLMREFEEFYVKKHPSWTLHAMSTRQNDKGTGYDHVDIQKAFKAYYSIVKG